MELRRPKRVVAVDECHRLQVAGRSQQLVERRIAKQLVPRANQPPALTRQCEECIRFPRRLDEWLLDVDVGSGQERLARGLEVRASGGADMHDVRPRLLEELGDGRKSGGLSPCGKRGGRRAPHILHPDDRMSGRDVPQRLPMVARHVAGANEGYTHNATALAMNSLMPMRALMRARRSEAARSSRRAASYEPTANSTLLTPSRFP